MDREREARRGIPGRTTSGSANGQVPTVGRQTLVEARFGSEPAIQRRGGGEGDPSEVHEAAARGVATPASRLPFGDLIQRCFGRHDVSAVQAHTGGAATASARAMGAEAYATGDHVVLGDRVDLHTVAHEAAHIVQQRGGVQLRVGAAGDAYEQHADAVADAVVQDRSAEGLLDRHAGGSATSASGAIQHAGAQPVQRMKVGGTVVSAYIDGKKKTKHVVADKPSQEALAKADLTDLTFVAAETDITSPVDAHGHDFPSSTTASAQFTITATVKIYQWKKTNGVGKGKDVALEVDGEDRQCEIGAIKTGEGKIKVVHFQKV